MKTIGMIGGMSWESSIEYYRIVNEAVKEKLGGTHSAKSVMVSVDFAEIEALQNAGDWGKATQVMIECARQVEAGGADVLVICTNTMHKMADEVQKKSTSPSCISPTPRPRLFKPGGCRKLACWAPGLPWKEISTAAA